MSKNDFIEESPVSSQNSTLSKGDANDVHVVESESSVQSPLNNYVYGDENNLSRGLQLRHLQMLSVVNVFGTGLFLSSGKTLYLSLIHI